MTPNSKAPDSGSPALSVLQVLQAAAEGLLCPSETDAPLTAFFWPDTEMSPLTPEHFRELASLSAEAPVKTVTLTSFFRPTTKEEDWHNEEEQAEVKRFQALVATLRATLQHLQVFRAGETKADVYIIGAVEGGWAGLQTVVVET